MNRFDFVVSIVYSFLFIGFANGFTDSDEYVFSEHIGSTESDEFDVSKKADTCCAKIIDPHFAKPFACPKPIGPERLDCKNNPKLCVNECTNDFDCEMNEMCCCRCGNKCLGMVEREKPLKLPSITFTDSGSGE